MIHIWCPFRYSVISNIVIFIVRHNTLLLFSASHCPAAISVQYIGFNSSKIFKCSQGIKVFASPAVCQYSSMYWPSDGGWTKSLIFWTRQTDTHNYTHYVSLCVFFCHVSITWASVWLLLQLYAHESSQMSTSAMWNDVNPHGSRKWKSSLP